MFVYIKASNDLYLKPERILSIRTFVGVGGTDFVIIDYNFNNQVREFQLEFNSKEEAKIFAEKLTNDLNFK